VAYLVTVDRSGRDFLLIENQNRTAAKGGCAEIRRVHSARSLPGLAV
jgi:hypothetical protein